MKKIVIFLVLSCLLAVCFVSCFKARDYEYVGMVNVEKIVTCQNYGRTFQNLIYKTGSELKTVKLVSTQNHISRFKGFNQGEEVFLYRYKKGDAYCISREEITEEMLKKEQKNLFWGICFIIWALLLYVYLHQSQRQKLRTKKNHL